MPRVARIGTQLNEIIKKQQESVSALEHEVKSLKNNENGGAE